MNSAPALPRRKPEEIAVTPAPAPALPDDIEPGLRAALARLSQLGLVTPDPALVGIAEARRVNEAYFGYLSEPMPDAALVEEITIASPAGRLALKLVFPDAGQPRGVVAYFHGGGFAFASIHTHERLMRRLALASGCVVAGVDYRRTPEHAYPAALEDAEAAWSWLRGGGNGRFGPAAMAACGDSAGANLALALTLRLRDAGQPLPDALALAYGMYDRTMTSASHRRYGDGRYGLSSARLEWFWNQYLARDAHAVDPRAVPALADVTGLPPVAAFVAERDCLADDTHALVGKLKIAGVPHSLDVFRDMTHGSLQLGALVPASEAALDLIGTRLAALLTGAGQT
jgi:acetyl esterase